MASTVSATTTTTSASSSVVTTTSSLQFPFQLLEISLISAQDLSPVSKSMKTYAVAWIQPDRKLRSRVDQQGHSNPTWNDKFVFRLDDKFLNSESSAVVIEIYTQAWIRDTLVGTVRVLINNLIPPSTRHLNNTSTRFVALQIRRPSGTPQGILNMGVSLLDTTMRSMPLHDDNNKFLLQHQQFRDEEDDDDRKKQINAKIQLWRSRSQGTELSTDDNKPGSVCNGSVVNGNGSELYSDVGPSASVVAAAIAKGLYPAPTAPTKALFRPEAAAAAGAAAGDDAESSILEDLTYEEAMAKGYRKPKMESWRKQQTMQLAVRDNETVITDQPSPRHSRRHSDGGGLFSCFGNAYGIEFTIVCGANNSNPNSGTANTNNNNNTGKNRKKKLGGNNKFSDQNIPLPSSRNSE